MTTPPCPIANTRSALRKVRRLATITFSVVLVAVCVQEGIRLHTRSSLSRNATFASAGTHKLRLHCTGSGDITYVLEAGATGFAETWSWVQDVLDDRARVCSYDRAGMGLSDPSPENFQPGQTARDLHAALTDAGETGPFVLVGHSLGGLLVRDFAAQFPDDTAALVLVDSSHENQLASFGEDMVAEFRAFPDLLSALAGVSMTGFLRLWNPLEAGAAGLEGHSKSAAHAFAGDRIHLATSGVELRHWDAITARVAKQQLSADLPVLAVTAGSPVPGSADFSHLVEPLHREIASRFTTGEQVVIKEADHFSILMKRENAQTLAALINDYVARMSPAERAAVPAAGNDFAGEKTL